MYPAMGTLEITTTVGCGIQCVFCPQELLTRRYRERSAITIMSLDTFKRCVDKVPVEVGIHFSGMAEPWLNRECTDMVLHAADRGHPLAVYSTLVGMTLGDFEQIKHLEFAAFVVHLPDEEARSPIPIGDTYRAVLTQVARHFGTAGRKEHFGVSCHGPLHPGIQRLIGPEVLAAEGSLGRFDRVIDRAGNITGSAVPHQYLAGPLACGLSGRHFNRNVLLPDGSVALCCMDYGLTQMPGNLLEMSYPELFESSASAGFQAALDGTEHIVCRRCHQAVPWERPYECLEIQPLLENGGSPLALQFSAFLAHRMSATRVVRFDQGRPVSWNPREIAGAVAVLPDANLLFDQPPPFWSALRRLVASVPAAVILRPCPGLERLAAADRLTEMERFSDRLGQHGLRADLAGWGLLEQGIATQIAVLTTAGGRPPVPAAFKVVALVAAYNEADIIARTIERLVADEIDVYLIDNWSTDGTYEIARSFLGRGLIGLERFPPEGQSPDFAWHRMLQRKEQLGRELEADWFIHHDADEIRESPWPGVGLREAFCRVDREGYTCVDFTVLNFRPVDDSYGDGSNLERHFRFYEFGLHPGYSVMVKAWKKSGERVVLAASGGHRAEFPSARVYPYKFLLRHYPIRTQHQGARKIFAERKPRWAAERKSTGWHRHYDHLRPGQSLLAHPSELLFLDESFGSDYLIERITGLGITPGTNCFPKAVSPAYRECLERQLAEANAAVAERDGRIDSLVQELAQARHQAVAMSKTLSWRVTLPLRRLKEAIPRQVRRRQSS